MRHITVRLCISQRWPQAIFALPAEQLSELRVTVSTKRDDTRIRNTPVIKSYTEVRQKDRPRAGK